ncbi:DUF4350 domain-containing protein [Streptomyces scopuliridis]|uniref:DUF4350 domain-containing protein n=1 Tax=Streptomyces scopuliridis TaxID=452529 RepID=A0ACD4ZN97_9ACTN|nr:DUF4350 domain-containing protein [Streptomyces scopuliridis]WSB99790.1 DUF4350 domain-containing protein [Streptomyces scopuliridis]WSC06511.1 DUF4350 domain-containing protein [Streptomyces scopuliridis]
MTSTIDSTSLSPTTRQVWTRSRGLVLALVILLAAGITMAALSSGGQHGRLDPRSADRFGSRAAAELLKDRGVSVEAVTTLDQATAAAGPDTTLLVTNPDLLTERQQRSLHTATASAGGRTVLLGAGPPSVDTLAPGVRTNTPAPVSARAPRCSLPAADRAGTVDIGGERYVTDIADTDACYMSDGVPTLLRIRDTGTEAGDTVLLGSPDILYNDRLDQRGNASLALQLLGSRPQLVWYLPSLSDGSAAESGGDSGFLGLIPSGWLWGAFQLFLAAVLAAVWRARRLGPLVAERLPVAIRASESTEGRARLYRKANVRDHAASSLRSATRDRLAPLLGVPSADAHSPDVLIPAVSARLPDTTRDPRTLLFGPVPTDDAALVRLADQLDALEREVRTS